MLVSNGRCAGLPFMSISAIRLYNPTHFHIYSVFFLVNRKLTTFDLVNSSNVDIISSEKFIEVNDIIGL